MTSHLTLILTKGGCEKGRRERGRANGERRKRSFRVRRSHFSLDFSTIGPSNPSETRGKVDPHFKSYVWLPILWSFGNFGR